MSPQTLEPFAFTRGNRKGSILIVGEAWGENEAHARQPFVGASGQELERMLREGGIDIRDCLFANVVDARPARNKMHVWLKQTKDARKAKQPEFRGLFAGKIIELGREKLLALISEMRPKLIITLGNWPLWALTSVTKVKNEKGYKVPTGVDTVRGSMLYADGTKIPLLPTYHPAAIFRQWKWRHIAVRDFQRAAAYIYHKLPWHDTREFKWLIQPTVREVRGWVDHFLAQPGETLDLVLDLETAAYQIHILGVKNPLDETCLCTPFFHLRKDGRKPVYSVHEFVSIAMHLRRLLTDPRVRLVGQNIIYDIQYLGHFFCYTPKVGDDTMIANYVMSPGERRSLDFMASVYCLYYSYWKEDRKISTELESTEMACRYNCMDLEYTTEIWRVQRKLLPKTGKLRQYAERLWLLHELFRMMNKGVKIDLKLRAQQRHELDIQIADIELWLDGCLPPEIKPERKQTRTGTYKTAAWYNSDTQLRTLLHDTLGLRPVYDEKTHAITLDKEALGTLAERHPSFKPFFNMLVLLRSLKTYKENFYDSNVDPDGYMRCAYNPAGPVSLRLASQENVFGGGHNLQNVPRKRNPLNFFNVIFELA